MRLSKIPGNMVLSGAGIIFALAEIGSRPWRSRSSCGTSYQTARNASCGRRITRRAKAVIWRARRRNGAVTMAIDTKKLKKQTAFCLDLMNRLSNDIEADIRTESWHGVFNHTQKKADIMRLRRELNTLNKILDPYGGK